MLILGVIGGILGLIVGIIALIIGWVSMAAGENNYLLFGGSLDIIFSIMGIVAGILAKSKTKLASILFLVAGVVGSIFITVFFVIGILFVIAAILGFVSLNKAKNNVIAS